MTSLSISGQTTSRSSSRFFIRSQVLETIPAPKPIRTDSLQLLVANIDYNPFVGRLAIGRMFSGEISKNQEVIVAKVDGSTQKTRVKELFVFESLDRASVDKAG